ncbi:MAG: DUF3108 domain-containing protein [Longimicrobiales bacterium]|nr:DUF3108 domain-containing protein [Longimicrobiales bacterium]
MLRILLCVAVLAVASDASAQAVPPVPFGPGERAEYAVSLGVFGNVGHGAMEVVGIEDVHGHPTYHLRFDLEGRVTFAKVDDTLESWLDVQRLFARRIHKDQHEVNYKTDRWYDFYPEEMVYQRRSSGETGELASPEPLDEVSFLYFVRTLPLEVGETYTFDRYYKESGNPVIIKVLRRETMQGADGREVPLVVVQPIIETSGLFGQGGEAEVYFTDDHRRILVRLTSKVPIIGRLGLTLTGYTPGTRLTSLPASGAAGQ